MIRKLLLSALWLLGSVSFTWGTNYLCPIDLGPDVDSCEGEAVVLDGTAAGSGNTYLWLFESPIGSGNFTPIVPAETGPTLTVTTTGVYRVEVMTSSGNCSDMAEVTFNPNPPDLGPFEIELCDDNDDGIQFFDLTFIDAQATGGNPDLFVSWYETLADENAGMAIADPTSYANLINPQTVFGRVESSIGCKTIVELTLIVQPQPAAIQPTPLTICDDNGDGFALFNLHEKDEEIAGGDPLLNISYHESQADALSNINQLISPYNNVVPFIQVIYARAEDSSTGCFKVVELELIVWVGCPIVDTPPDDIFVNEGDDDGLAIFDLTVNESLMLGSQDPGLFSFTYHETLSDSDTGSNAIANPTAYQNIANPQTIYVRLTNNDNGSYVLTDFEIETDGILGLEELLSESVVIYPNPVQNNVFVHSNGTLTDLEIRVFDMNGRQLITESTDRIDVSQLPAGMFWIQVSANGQRLIKPLVKE